METMKMKNFPRVLSLAAAIGMLALAAPVAAAGDPAAGKIVSAKCAICHTFEAGKNKIGPSLAGVVGRHAAALPDFSYSPAMKSSNLTHRVSNAPPPCPVATGRVHASQASA